MKNRFKPKKKRGSLIRKTGSRRGKKIANYKFPNGHAAGRMGGHTN